MTTVISTQSLHVHSECGTYSAFLEAGVAQDIPDILLPRVLTAGAILGDKLSGEATGGSQEDKAAERERKVDALTTAMKEILDAGDPALLDPGGIPLTAVLDEKVGFRSNKADREAAWANVEG